ncbi:MAG: starch-binding protein, partial [Ruminococcus sp.]|nr:starch-binding protein [Ruminococcus sp.]
TDNIGNALLGDNVGFYLLDKGDKYWPYETYEYAEDTEEESSAADTEATTVTEEATTVAQETETTTAAQETETTTAPEETTTAAQETETTTAPEETTTVAQETETTTAPEETTTAPQETEPEAIKVYCINSAKWDAVCAYYWGGASVTWPGKAMTKTGETVNGFDVYEYTFEVAPQNIIFNNNNKGAQTADLTFQAGQYFDVKGGKWYKSLDDVPAVSASSTDRYLVGSFNGWSTTANEFLSADGTIGRVEMELAANTTYEFKIVREGTWTSCKETLSITDSATGLTFSSSVAGNTKLTTKNAGTYVFEFDLSASQLTVTYP